MNIVEILNYELDELYTAEMHRREMVKKLKEELEFNEVRLELIKKRITEVKEEITEQVRTHNGT